MGKNQPEVTFAKKDEQYYNLFVATPEKRHRIGVSPLRVLVDPTALPREVFGANREAGLWILGAEASIAAGAILLGASKSPEAGALLYIAIRMAAAISTYISNQTSS